MNLAQPTLVQFEQVRKENDFIPIIGSNSFYNIGEGKIDLLTQEDNNTPFFDLSINSGHVYTGAGRFDVNSNGLYRSLKVIPLTELSVNQELRISGTTMIVHGKLNLMRYSRLIVENGGSVILYPDSELTVNNDVQIDVTNGRISIYGIINIHLSQMDKIYSKGIYIDTAATTNVMGLEQLGKRSYSLTDYLPDLREILVSPHSRGEHNHEYGRIGYSIISTDSKPDGMTIIELKCLQGESVLGDFKLFVLGVPKDPVYDSWVIKQLTILENSVLYVSESFHDDKYLKPELCLGKMLGNDKEPGKCVVKGELIARGASASINIDRNSSLVIEKNATVRVQENACIKSALNADVEVLTINGTLIIDDIEQLDGFSPNQIVIGESGKVIILNPNSGSERVLLSIPIGIKNSELYRLFGNRLDKVEYHLPKNTGIKIDKFCSNYSVEMNEWYNGIRIEKAVYDKMIIWEPGAFILLDQEIIPWVDASCSLLHAARLFKSSGFDDKAKLQDVVGRLKYAGFNNILFIFKYEGGEKRVTLTLESASMVNSIYEPSTRSYRLITDNEADLFIRNHASNTNFESIVNRDSTHLIVTGTSVDIPI